MSDDEAGRYRFGPLERRGLVAGWRATQVGIVAIGLFVAVGCLRVLSTGPGIVAAVVSVALAVAMSTWPIGGRTGDEWLPDVTRHGVTIAKGRTWLSQAEKLPARGPFSTLRILEVDPEPNGAERRLTGHSRAGEPIAVVYDSSERTYTAVMPASGEGFVLLAPADRDRAVSGWSAALSSLARQGTPVHRVQWIARSVPGGAPAEVSPIPGGRFGDPAGLSAVASYREVLEATRTDVRRHQVLVAMSVRGARTAMSLRPPNARDHSDACRHLVTELGSFRRRVSDASIKTAAPMSPRALASAFRAGFSSSRWTWPEGCSTTWPWPVAGEVLWDALRVDGTWHATYWIAEWPRSDVGSDFLAPLLLASDVRQSVSLTMQPLSPLEATRKAQQARTADVADAELRRHGGFLRTARRTREEETVADRERELADGHAPFRFSGFVTVTADAREALEDSCSRVEQAAGQCGMEMRRCFGDQLRGFTFTLPLCRGVG